MAQPTRTMAEQDFELLQTNSTLPSWRWITQYLVNDAGSDNLIVDGSTMPQTFSYSPPDGYDFVAIRMIILLLTTTPMTLLTNFADLGAPLANGVEFKANNVLISTWQDNLDMYTDFYDKFPPAAIIDVAQDISMTGRWTFTKDTSGQAIIVSNGQTFSAIVNDNLSSLSQFRMKIKGKLVAR